MTKFLTGAAMAAALTALAATPSSAADVKLGVLTCKVQDVDNAIVYTSQRFACTFAPSEGAKEKYTGKIEKVGIDLSIKKDFTLVWAVVAPSHDNYHPDALAGTYVGAGADAAIGAGAGANVLVGGGDNSFSLQPISVSGMTGAGASVGIEKFTLS